MICIAAEGGIKWHAHGTSARTTLTLLGGLGCCIVRTATVFTYPPAVYRLVAAVFTYPPAVYRLVPFLLTVRTTAVEQVLIRSSCG